MSDDPSDDLRNPIGLPMDDPADKGEATEEDYEEVAEMDEAISDDPSYGEDGADYDPATQAPRDAER